MVDRERRYVMDCSRLLLGAAGGVWGAVAVAKFRLRAPRGCRAATRRGDGECGGARAARADPSRQRGLRSRRALGWFAADRVTPPCPPGLGARALGPRLSGGARAPLVTRVCPSINHACRVYRRLRRTAWRVSRRRQRRRRAWAAQRAQAS